MTQRPIGDKFNKISQLWSEIEGEITVQNLIWIQLSETFLWISSYRRLLVRFWHGRSFLKAQDTWIQKRWSRYARKLSELGKPSSIGANPQDNADRTVISQQPRSPAICGTDTEAIFMPRLMISSLVRLSGIFQNHILSTFDRRSAWHAPLAGGSQSSFRTDRCPVCLTRS
jgi:hypothetical protein